MFNFESARVVNILSRVHATISRLLPENTQLTLTDWHSCHLRDKVELTNCFPLLVKTSNVSCCSGNNTGNGCCQHNGRCIQSFKEAQYCYCATKHYKFKQSMQYFG
ncbi:hypothetical protein GQX74_014401 [Glossina fuscipes]|nr:hypothetical protein GQX74_014401 [Glossina fuscipes]